jgi:Zn-dependent protease with chaperone function
VLLVALGLTPLGARFVHLIAPDATAWRVAVAMEIIVVLAWGGPRQLTMWWLRRARRASPAGVRARPSRRLRLNRWLVVAYILAAVMWLAARPLPLDGVTLTVLVTFVAGGILQQHNAVRGLSRLPKPQRLVTALESLPGPPAGMAVTVAVGWRTPIATAAAMSSPGRGGIVVAPPLLAALTDAQLRAVVAHELAHLRHHDTWWRLLRRLLILLASTATALTLYTIPGLRGLAGQHGGHLTGQSLPFLLAVGYLAFKVLRVAELRACRAEEAAADREAVRLTGDVHACLEGTGKACEIVGSPESLSLPRRLLTATHPAMGERLRLISAASPDGAPGSARPRQVLPAFAAVTVTAFVVGGFALFSPLATATPPATMGWYKVLPPSRFEGAVFSGTSQSSVWSAGIARFSDAVPVSVVYNQSGQPWLYMWGAYGNLANPAAELAAFWQASDPFAEYANPSVLPGSQLVDAEPAGPLGGYLQCSETLATCAWADYSGIIVVSQAPPSQFNTLVQISAGPAGNSEQTLARLTLSFRGAAELLRHARTPATQRSS